MSDVFHKFGADSPSYLALTRSDLPDLLEPINASLIPAAPSTVPIHPHGDVNIV